jgi:hypothetical protein
MPLVVTNDGAILLIDWAVHVALAVDAPLALALFQNDYTPGKGSVFADFVEPTFSGYARRPISRALWTVPTVVGGRAESVYNSVPFEWVNASPPVTLFGYFVLAPSTLKVLWAERFNTSRTIPTGSKLQVQPAITGVTEFVS